MRSEEEIRAELQRLRDFHPSLEHIVWFTKGRIDFGYWVLSDKGEK